jgi:hypothetical protein
MARYPYRSVSSIENATAQADYLADLVRALRRSANTPEQKAALRRAELAAEGVQRFLVELRREMQHGSPGAGSPHE